MAWILKFLSLIREDKILWLGKHLGLRGSGSTIQWGWGDGALKLIKACENMIIILRGIIYISVVAAVFPVDRQILLFQYEENTW